MNKTTTVYAVNESMLVQIVGHTINGLGGLDNIKQIHYLPSNADVPRAEITYEDNRHE